MDGWMDGWMDGRMDGWMDDRLQFYSLPDVFSSDRRERSHRSDHLKVTIFVSDILI